MQKPTGYSRRESLAPSPGPLDIHSLPPTPGLGMSPCLWASGMHIPLTYAHTRVNTALPPHRHWGCIPPSSGVQPLPAAPAPPPQGTLPSPPCLLPFWGEKTGVQESKPRADKGHKRELGVGGMQKAASAPDSLPPGRGGADRSKDAKRRNSGRPLLSPENEPSHPQARAWAPTPDLPNRRVLWAPHPLRGFLDRDLSPGGPAPCPCSVPESCRCHYTIPQTFIFSVEHFIV